MHDFRVEASQRFPKSARLIKPAEFRRVFSDAAAVKTRGFTLLYRPTDQAHARLGLAIAKKSLPLAVQRNRVKRLVREAFRHHAARLPAVDIIVMTRPVARDQSKQDLRRELDDCFDRLRQRFSD